MSTVCYIIFLRGGGGEREGGIAKPPSPHKKERKRRINGISVKYISDQKMSIVVTFPSYGEGGGGSPPLSPYPMHHTFA